MMFKCFIHYYRHVFHYIDSLVSLATRDNYYTSRVSLTLSGAYAFVSHVMEVEWFGVGYLLLAVVIVTTLFDAATGVAKSVTISNRALKRGLKIEDKQSPEYIKAMRIHKYKKFDPSKLLYTFFKIFTLLAYLFFANTFMEMEDPNAPGIVSTVMGLTMDVLIKAPLAIFWYYDFKSIGQNLEFLFNKKLPIFGIVTMFFERQIKRIKKENEED